MSQSWTDEVQQFAFLISKHLILMKLLKKTLINYRPVRIIRLLSKDTIEEGMYKIAQEKLILEKKITDDEGKLYLHLLIITKEMLTHEKLYIL